MKDPEMMVYVLRQRRPRMLLRSLVWAGGTVLLAAAAIVWRDLIWLAAIAACIAGRYALSVARIERKLREIDE